MKELIKANFIGININTPLLIFSLILLALFACNKEDEGQINTNSPIDMKLRGVSQKGPFAIGSNVTIQELNHDYSPNGVSFQVATTDNHGTFLLNTEISTKLVEIICTGFYYNEVTGEITNTNLTVRSIAQVTENMTSNINILTTLASKRIIHLMNDNDLTFDAAKKQAEKEVLLIFNIYSESTAEFNEMNILGGKDSDAILLAISVMLQGKGSVSDLSILTSKIIQDIEKDGLIDDEVIKDQIIQNAMDISLSDIRKNLIAKYEELDVSLDVPDFESIVSNVYQNKPPIVSITSPVDEATIKQGELVNIEVDASDEDGEIEKIQIYLNDTLVSESTNFSWQLKSAATPQSIRVMAIDDEGANSLDSIGFNVRPNSLPDIQITSINNDVELIDGSETEIIASFSDEEDPIKRVSFLVDEHLIAEFSNPNPNQNLITSWKVDGIGDRFIIAEVEDEFGNINRDSVNIKIIPNQLPEILILSPIEFGEIKYGTGTEIILEVNDADGWIRKIDWYLEDQFAGGTMNNDLPPNQSNISYQGELNVFSTNEVQTLKVEAIDNLNDTARVEINVSLAPGAYWKNINSLSNFEIDQVSADNDFFYIRSNDKIYRSGIDLNPIQILDLKGNNSHYTLLLEEVYDNQLLLIEWDYELLETKVWISGDQGSNWNSFKTTYITAKELFVFDEKLYAIDESKYIYRLDDDTWSLVQGSTLPWASNFDLDELNVLEFSGSAFALEDDLSSTERGIWKSTDLYNWNKTSSINVQDGTFSSQWIIEYEGAIWIFVIGNEIFRSIDGSNWIDISSNDVSVSSFISVIQKGDRLYLFSSSNNGTLYILETFGL